MAKTLIQAELAQFTGSERWHRQGINRNVIYTDGAKYVADQYEAHWLLDEIALIQLHNSRVAREAFQVWKLWSMAAPKCDPQFYGSLRASISMALAIFTAVSAISVIREATNPLNLS